jgi:flavin-binding protein dodecin
MPAGIVKIIELVGTSEHSFSDAVREAVRTASLTIRNITGVEVLRSTADVNAAGELTAYKVTCKLAFLVDAPHLESAGLGDDTPSGAELTLGGVTSSQDLAVGGGPDERGASH